MLKGGMKERDRAHMKRLNAQGWNERARSRRAQTPLAYRKDFFSHKHTVRAALRCG
ncbi:hypothetical protein [Tolypothrix sp. VBCCA 56010]|uniref:hypothetical protein n=1 Tax=Tolypothrix sp. VBCCA 56010 TaxID=3137731 RepID=UPI003D7F09ED